MSARLRTGRHAGSTPAGKANRQGVAQQAERRAWDAEAAGSCPATVTKYPFRSMAGRCALNADTVVRFHQGVPIPVQWRNGNAALCKSVMSRFDTDLHLQELHLQELHLQDLHLHALVARMDRPPPSKRTHAGSNPAESAVA